MERKSFWTRIKEILGPIFVKEIVGFVVMTILISIYIAPKMPDVLAVADSQEKMLEKMLEITEGVYQYIVEITAAASLAAIPFLLLMRKKDRRIDISLGIVPNKKASWKKYILIAGVSIPLAVVANNLLTLSNLAELSVTYQETAEALYTPSLLVQIICLGIIVPICEELVFRGLIYKRMRRDKSAIGAIITSSLVFGLWHMNSVQMIYGIICGILLAYLYEKYGSVKAPIFAHMLMNTVICILTELDAFTWMFSRSIVMAVITIGSAALGSTVLLFVQRIDERPFA